MSKKTFQIPTPSPAASSSQAWIADKEQTKVLMVPMPEELHYRVKVHCLEHRIAMAELVRKLLSRELAERQRGI